MQVQLEILLSIMDNTFEESSLDEMRIYLCGGWLFSSHPAARDLLRSDNATITVTGGYFFMPLALERIYCTTFLSHNRQLILLRPL